MAMVDEGGKGEAQPPGLDPRTRRSAATRATDNMDGGGRGEEWEGPPATCSRSRRRRCLCLSPSPAWMPPSGARGAAISATVAIRRAGGPSGSPSPRRRRQRGRFPHHRRPIIRPRSAVPVLGSGLCGGSKWFPPGSRCPPRRDPRCSPRKDGDLLYPAIHSPTELLSEWALPRHPRLPPPPLSPFVPRLRVPSLASPAPPPPSRAENLHGVRFAAIHSPTGLLSLRGRDLLHGEIHATLQGRTRTCSTPRSTPPPSCFPTEVANSSYARSTLLSMEGRGPTVPRCGNLLLVDSRCSAHPVLLALYSLIEMRVLGIYCLKITC
jgi:hypothetical protein